MLYRHKVLVTGCGGFIGSHLCEHLTAKGDFVYGIDNFSTGNARFLSDLEKNENFEFIEKDLGELPDSLNIFDNVESVYHLAANADVRHGPENTKRDLEQNTINTYKVLEASRLGGVKNFIFSSTGSVYGESKEIPTPEFCPMPVQTSLYGASKLAGEGLIQAFCEAFGMKCWIFRFVSILGPRYSHGHVFDFLNQLRKDPKVLSVLGDGRQKKSYLHVHDCVEAIDQATQKSDENVNIFNLGVDNYCEVNDSIGWILDQLGITPEVNFSGGQRGWVGDNPFIYLNTNKIRSLGWKPKFTIEESVRKTVDYLNKNQWLLDTRA